MNISLNGVRWRNRHKRCKYCVYCEVRASPDVPYHNSYSWVLFAALLSHLTGGYR